MRLRSLLASVSVAILIASFCITPTIARSAAPVTITLTRAPDFTEAGWTMTGAVVDGGTWTTGKAVEVESPVAFVVAAVWTSQQGTQGTFSIRFQGIEGTPAGHPFAGTWVLAEGTGRYAGLRGGGTWSEADDAGGNHVFTVLGSVH